MFDKKLLFFLGIIVVVLNYSTQASAQQAIHQQLAAEYDSTRSLAPREKLYVHFDKNVYAQQDTLWFKAYLVNTTLNDYSTISGVIYTEIINAQGEVVSTLALPTTLGLTWGAFAIKESNFVPGIYTFRAYTRWMQNFGDTYIFKREITVVDTSPILQSVVNSTQSTKNGGKTSSIVKAARDIDLQLLPEGGTWLGNTNQKMAFKAVNSAGNGVALTGEIVDAKQQKVVAFKSNRYGMGHFYMLPKLDELYTARIKIGDLVIEKKLPPARQIGSALHVDTALDPDSILISITSTLENEKLAIIGQSKGMLCFVATMRANTSRRSFKVAKSNFATGVCQIIVMNEKKQVLNKRNFFLDFNDQLKITMTTPVQNFGNRDSIPIQINVVDGLGKPVSGSFSIAITDDGQVFKDKNTDPNILTYLLLTSDLKGEIENPAQYFDKENPEARNDLDLLMLTQGWVSYAWPSKLKPVLKAEKEFVISGTVTNLTNKPSVGAKVTLLGKNISFLLMDTTTNEQGEFVFDRLPAFDSASFVIQALNAKGKRGTLGIAVNEFVRPPIVLKTPPLLESSTMPDTVIEKFIAIKNETEQAALKNGIILREVKIVGKRSIKGSKNLNGAGQASQILTERELEPIAKKSLYDVLVAKIKGFRTGNRRKSIIQDFFINGDLARFVIDGIELDYFYEFNKGPAADDYLRYIKGYLDYYSAEDITGIETMEMGLSFRYKSEFMNPMDEATYAFIEITTKTGSGPFLKKSANMYLLKPVNYGNNKVFYHPKYTDKTKGSILPDYRSTLYWQPNIVTDDNGNATISFFSADKKGVYTVWLEGSDTKGGLGMKTMKINIK